MSLDHKGYVGLFSEPLRKEKIEEIVLHWIERYGNIEQASGNSYQIQTTTARSLQDLVWEKNLQFRILCGEQFAWVYITMDRFVIETSGLAPQDGSILCYDVLQGLPGCEEIINEKNDSRLDELEKFGLM